MEVCPRSPFFFFNVSIALIRNLYDCSYSGTVLFLVATPISVSGYLIKVVAAKLLHGVLPVIIMTIHVLGISVLDFLTKAEVQVNAFAQICCTKKFK